MSSIIAFSHSLKKLNLIAGVIAGLSLMSASHSRAGDDPVLASFQRMFDHQPISAAHYRGSNEESDPLQTTVNAALRGDVTRSEEDPVLASFRRMFDHQPMSAAYYRGSNEESDPVQTMVNAALRGLRSSAPGTAAHVGPLTLNY